MRYAYRCPQCGLIESTERADMVQCRCGYLARRRFQIRVDRSSLRQAGRWDPVVGEYVANDAEFRSKLASQAERESVKLGMDVKLATVDARDSEGLAELHGWKDREADLEATKRANYDAAQA